MQFLPLNKVKPGMVLGKSFYHHDGRILLRAGITLQQAYINKLQNQGYHGAYIDDLLSKDIVITDIISDELRSKTIQKIKSVFIGFQEENNKAVANVVNNMAEIKALVKKIVEQILESRGTVVNIIDLKNYDEYTYQHSVNVAVISIVLGVSAGFKNDMLFNIGMAALFHDLGKLKIPRRILLKHDKLDNAEFIEIKNHPRYGYEFIKEHFDLHTITYISVLQHHEKYDGSGYPDGRDGSSIVMPAKIIAVADVYDAITSLRPYNQPMLPSDAFEYIMANSSIHFDPEIIKMFVTKIAPYPLGTKVRLSNGMKGIVAKNYSDCIMRPKVKVIPEFITFETPIRYFDLKNDVSLYNITITGME